MVSINIDSQTNKVLGRAKAKYLVEEKVGFISSNKMLLKALQVYLGE